MKLNRAQKRRLRRRLSSAEQPPDVMLLKWALRNPDARAALLERLDELKREKP